MAEDTYSLLVWSDSEHLSDSSMFLVPDIEITPSYRNALEFAHRVRSWHHYELNNTSVPELEKRIAMFELANSLVENDENHIAPFERYRVFDAHRRWRFNDGIRLSAVYIWSGHI